MGSSEHGHMSMLPHSLGPLAMYWLHPSASRPYQELRFPLSVESVWSFHRLAALPGHILFLLLYTTVLYGWLEQVWATHLRFPYFATDSVLVLRMSSAFLH